ncbi:uncharacterized protein LOC144048554 [Vanacampus margaritifer]
MLKELVRERLIAAADEIFGLFERTIASYEEQVFRAKEESERHRRHLEAVCKTQIVIRAEGVQQAIGPPQELPTQLQWGRSPSLEQENPQRPQVEETEEHPKSLHVKVEKKDPKHPEVEEAEKASPFSLVKDEDEDDNVKFPLTVVVVKSEADKDEQPERSPLRNPSGGAASEKPSAPLSDSDSTEERLSSNADCTGDNKQLKCSERETKPSKKMFHKKMRASTQENTFSCSVCSKTFSQKGTLGLHMRIHTGEKPYSCSFCARRFTLKSHMISHMRTHTGEKPYSCSTCGKMFSLNENMIKHMRIHTGEKRFNCSFCGKTFTMKSHMISHMRTHTGEKPFCCTICGKTFTLKQNMISHMRTHTGEKPFTCSTCGKGFSRKATMVKHEDSHSRITL